MTVYKLLPDYDNYAAFTLPMKDLIRQLGTKIPPARLMHFYRYNLSLAEHWVGINASFEPVEGVTEGQTVPDISTWVSGTLVLSEKSRTMLSSLDNYGEMLPVDTDHGVYSVLNCTTIVAADESRSSRVVESGQVLDINELAFNDAALDEKLLFKTDYDGFRSLFCTDKFRHQVMDNGLGGLFFSEQLAGAFK